MSAFLTIWIALLAALAVGAGAWGVLLRLQLRRAPAGAEASLEWGVEADLGPMARLAAPQQGQARDDLKTLLLRAGVRAPEALPLFLCVQVVGLVLLPMAWLLLAGSVSTLLLAGGAILGALAGYSGPKALLAWRARVRRETLARSVPDALDMLVSCLEAGLGLDAALRYVSRELALAAPLLSRELHEVNAQVAAGMPRGEALRRLDHRTGVAELGALVGVLGQVERMGSGVAAVLRPHAALSRRQRVLDAERRAAEASPRITVVMIVFIMPALFIVILGPTIVHIVQRLMPTLAGGAAG